MQTETNRFSEIGKRIGTLVEGKNKAYGSAFEKSGEILQILFPKGIKPEQEDDVLAIIRVIDKLFRIATNKNALEENPWEDIAGYAILAIEKDERKVGENGK